MRVHSDTTGVHSDTMRVNSHTMGVNSDTIGVNSDTMGSSASSSAGNYMTLRNTMSDSARLLKIELLCTLANLARSVAQQRSQQRDEHPQVKRFVKTISTLLPATDGDDYYRKSVWPIWWAVGALFRSARCSHINHVCINVCNI
jgi:hypothetical protein